MFTRSILTLAVAASAVTFASGQTPEAGRAQAPAAQGFAFALAGDGGYLGVQTAEVNKENFGKFGLREVRGVAIEKVVENSPASAAGLQDGDVIIRVGSEEITSGRKLSRLISEIAPDHQVRLTVLRGGNEREITATLGKRQMPGFQGGSFGFPAGIDLEKFREMRPPNAPAFKDFPRDEMPRVFAPGTEGKNFVWRAGDGRQIGIGVITLSEQLSETYGVDGGVMITTVREGAPAERAGLRAGDIIVDVDGKAVKRDIDLIRTISEKKDGDVQVTILRDKSRQTISVTPEKSKDNGFIFEMDGDTPRPPAGVRIAPPAFRAIPMSVPMPGVPMTAPLPATLLGMPHIL